MLKITKAKKDDMKTIAEFINSSADWYREFVDPKDMDQHEVGANWIEDNYQRRNFYLATAKGEDVGTITTQYFGDVTYLGYIYLDVNHVGKGYGHKLIDHAKGLSMQKGMNSMVLIAHPEATWATKAYEKYGFKRIATKKEDVLSFNGGMLKSYYEEGFHLYLYDLEAEQKTA